MDFIGNVLIELQKRNMTQIELCEKIGISINTFRGWVSKKVQPPVDVAYRIAEVLNCSVDYLVSGKKGINESKLSDIKIKLEEIISEI